MQQYSELLLDVWREACRHIEIADSVARITPLLSQHFPPIQVYVRQLSLDRGTVETVAASAAAGQRPALPARNECSSMQMEHLVDWCQQHRITRRTGDKLKLELPGIAPEHLAGDVLAGPLVCEHGLLGALIIAGDTAPIFDREHERLAKLLLEPFTVALENDHRLRELITLRERAEAENRSLLSKLGRDELTDTVVGAEGGLKAVMDRVSLVARADIPILILGETGSGKEVVARTIHKQSKRADGPFLRVNCGAIPPDLVDSELFGHEKGSFTGATGVRKGWFERADGGTLFLDECGELTPAAQVRLLRVLQDGTFDRVGSERPLHVDVRIVAATHRDLKTMVTEGTFREDLWYRLAVFPVDLPPLRQRPEDIPAMASHFAARAARRLGLKACVPTVDDIQQLTKYPWPGNVRELASVMERAAILGQGQFLDVGTALGSGPAIPDSTQLAGGKRNGATPQAKEIVTLDNAMRIHIEHALEHTRGRIEGRTGAAALLGINPHTLRARMRKLAVDWSRFRE
ncbi:MAG TPA: sigma-54 dependent transcriptional regulator [Pirellulaceae bacterium]|nr:sigma-54 dependent transcriptional regulator [Pirellulaceae bacterium]